MSTAPSTELGRQASEYMTTGQFVPDELVVAMVRERLETSPRCLLDGFPRTLAQCVALDDVLTLAGRRLTAVVFIDVSDETVIERIAGRDDDVAGAREAAPTGAATSVTDAIAGGTSGLAGVFRTHSVPPSCSVSRRTVSHLVVVDDGFGWWPAVNALELGIAAGVDRITIVTPSMAFATGIPPRAVCSFSSACTAPSGSTSDR